MGALGAILVRPGWIHHDVSPPSAHTRSQTRRRETARAFRIAEVLWGVNAVSRDFTATYEKVKPQSQENSRSWGLTLQGVALDDSLLLIIYLIINHLDRLILCNDDSQCQIPAMGQAQRGSGDSKGVRDLAGATGKVQRRRTPGTAPDLELLPADPAADSRTDSLRSRLLGGKACSEALRSVLLLSLAVENLFLREDPVQKTLAKLLDTALDPADLDHVCSQADDHWLFPVYSFVM